MAAITIDVDLPPDVTITAYRRHGDGHGFEVSWPLPTRCRCDRCHRQDAARLEFPDKVQVVRDLDIWGQPSFWIYQPAHHRCPHCHHRQYLIPPFRRKEVSYTYRFEQHVLRLLIGSNEEEVARRLGISAEMVRLIVRNQLADAQARQVDPRRVIKDVGIDELSLKKRHKLFVTILTDLTDPERPAVVAVAEGRDEAAARECLEKLAPEQRQQVTTYRADMALAFHNACRELLPNARPVVDRFHVAKLFNEAVDGERKKNHPGVQGQAVEGPAEGVPVADVGVPPQPPGPDRGGAGQARGVVSPAAAAAGAARAAGAVPADLRHGGRPEEGATGIAGAVPGHAEGLPRDGQLHPHL
jgi:transposase